MHLTGDGLTWFGIIASFWGAALIGALSTKGVPSRVLAILTAVASVAMLLMIPVKLKVTPDGVTALAMASLAPLTVGIVALMIRSLRVELFGAFKGLRPANRNEQSPRVFVPPGFSFKDASALTEGHTDIRAKRLVSPYIGKWVDVRGTIVNITEWSTTVSVTLKGEPILSLSFDNALLDQVATYQKGAVIAARGCIWNITRHSANLDGCEILTGPDADGAIQL